MNVLTLIGRITKDPEIRYSDGAEAVAYGSYTIAVDRPTKGEKITDFIYCKLVGKNAEFAEKYLRKGMKIAIVGRVQVDNYKDREGNNKRMMYVQVQKQEFCESKASNSNATQPTQQDAETSDGFMQIPYNIDEELPFN